MKKGLDEVKRKAAFLSSLRNNPGFAKYIEAPMLQLKDQLERESRNPDCEDSKLRYNQGALWFIGYWLEQLNTAEQHLISINRREEKHERANGH